LEKRLLGAHAPGFAPALKSLEIKRESGPVEIRLKHGALLRVRVVDRTGQPIAGFEAKVIEWPSGMHSGGDHLPGRWAYPAWQLETDAHGHLVCPNYEDPLLSGTADMHDWQFRIEADGYEPAVSRLVRDEERGARLNFQLQPRPLPEMIVPAPTGTKRVTASVAVQPRTVRRGETLTLFVKARIAPGHHIYALEDSGCSNLPTSLDATLRGVITPDGPWHGPEPKQHDDGSRTLTGEVLFKRHFLVESGAGGKTHKLPATLRFQVCNEALCWPPETITLETEFEVVMSPD